MSDATLPCAFTAPRARVAGTLPAEVAGAGEVRMLLLEAQLRPLTRARVAVEAEAAKRALLGKALAVRAVAVAPLQSDGAGSVNSARRPCSPTSGYRTVDRDVARSAAERFDAEGISIPSPQRDVHSHRVAATR